MQNNKEERSIQQALGSVPKVNNQRAFSATVTIAGTGTVDITANDVYQAATSQHQILRQNDGPDQLYVHEIRAYGTAGGYLSMAPYPHRQWVGFPGGTVTQGPMFNCYGDNPSTTFRKDSLTQMYEFGINGATRPELVWTYPKNEILNNPLVLFIRAFGQDGEEIGSFDPSFATKLCTVQSTNTGGGALYIVQFDVTFRNSEFIPIASTVGAAAFGEENVMVDNYKPPPDVKKKIEEGEKAEEQANKKRKIKSVKDLTMPVLDSK